MVVRHNGQQEVTLRFPCSLIQVSVDCWTRLLLLMQEHQSVNARHSHTQDHHKLDCEPLRVEPC